MKISKIILAGCLISVSALILVFPSTASAAKVYKTFKNLNMGGLTTEQTEMVLDLLNHNDCKCGCTKGSLAHCVETDIHCTQSKFLSKEIVDKARAGKGREYLLGIIDGFNHAKKHSKKEKKADLNKVHDVKVGEGVFKGPGDALITLVEFTDYECPFCKRGYNTIKQLLKKYPDNIKLYVRNNPLPFHKRAKPAAMAALAAEGQGKFWEMHDLLFSNKDFSDKNLLKYAKMLNLDLDRFKADLKSKTLEERIKNDMAEAQRLGARGTPAFFLNGQYLRGAQPLNKFVDLVEKLLKEKKK